MGLRMKIIFATTNPGKLKEIKAILPEYEISSLKEEGIDIDIEETGKSFEENAVLKALTIMKMTGNLVLADDSGLEVDFINKEPGIYSARYLGEGSTQQEKNRSIIKRLEEAQGEERKARFTCAIAAVFPDGRVFTAHGIMEGLIGYEERGENGFGYDSIFYVPEYNLTAAQMSAELKNKISHRYKALCAIADKLKTELGGGKS